MLQRHLLEHTAVGPSGLLFPGDRTDHMSMRYLMDRYRPAREAAGRPDLTIHHLRHTALTLAGQHGATADRSQIQHGSADYVQTTPMQFGSGVFRRAALAPPSMVPDGVSIPWAPLRFAVLPVRVLPAESPGESS